MAIFDFTFNPYALLSYLSVVADIVVLYLIFSEGLQVSTNRWFSLSVFPMIIWGATEAFSRLSATAYAARFWETFGSVGWIFSSPLFLAFTIAYIGRERILSKISFQLLLFGPALFFLYLSWSVGVVVNQNLAAYQRLSYDWIGNLDTPLFKLVFGWIDILFIISFILLFRFWRVTKESQKRTQVFLMVIGFLVPLVGGTITNGLFPILGIHFLRLAVPLATVLYVLVAYAILKYKLFAINPAMLISNIVETMNEILVVLDVNHFVEFVNDAVEKILGFKKADVVNQHIRKLVGSDWAAFREKVLQELDAGRAVSGVEVNFADAGGKKIPVNFSASQLKDSKGQVFGAVGVATDVRKTQELLTDVTAERNKLSSVMQSVVDGVLALDQEGRVFLVNPSALAMLGEGEKEVTGKRLEDCLTLFDRDQKITISDLLPKKAVTQDSIVLQRRGVEITAAAGKKIFVNLTSSTIKEGHEVGLGAIITLGDVSKEKELEEMKLDFVSMAAHELRTPLTAIRGYLAVLQEETRKLLNREQNSFLDKAFISSTQLAALVENLLSVSKIERGAMKLEVSSTDWSAVLNDSVINFQQLSGEKGVSLTLKTLPDLPKVMVDKFRIVEVLSNLIANAIAYTKPGGAIEVSSEVKGKEVITHIKDTGQGIPESAISHLFTKFFRVSGVLEQGSKGTGLGLYISKAIVDMHQGKIWVESKLGVGSTFSFTIPVAQGSNQTKAKEKEDTAAALPAVNPASESKKPAKLFKRRNDHI